MNIFLYKFEFLTCLERSIFTVLTSFFFCIMFGKWIVKQFKLMQVEQHIRQEGPKSHYKKSGTPTMGGIIMIFSIYTSTFIWINSINKEIFIVFFSTISFSLIGFIDDHIIISKKRNNGLKTKEKIVLQIIVSSIITCFIISLPNFSLNIKIPFIKNEFIDLNFCYFLLSVFILVGTSNAINLNDGMDGMAIGNTVISFLTYMIVIFSSGSLFVSSILKIKHIPICQELIIYCGSFVGSAIGFLWFNTYPAEIFMGNIGAFAIGGSLGTIAILSKQEILLSIIGGIFVLESLSVILQVFYFKITKGKRLFKMAPIHHHFELKKLSEPKIVIRFWIISFILGTISIISLKMG